MDLKEYMSVRCACNVVRQETPAKERLTFDEFAILCHLYEAGEELRTSEIADYQGVLRPTMTHRTNHLARLGLITRHEGESDRRNVCCKISEKGIEVKDQLCAEVCNSIQNGAPLHRSSPERICKFVDAMGTMFCMSGDLVLLALQLSGDDSMSVSQIVRTLGLLQPTVSMSVSSLVDRGLVSRNRATSDATRTLQVGLTPEGKARALELTAEVNKIVVRRNRRGRNEEEETASE